MLSCLAVSRVTRPRNSQAVIGRGFQTGRTYPHHHLSFKIQQIISIYITFPLDLILDGAFTYMRDEPKMFGMEYERPCAQEPEAERRLSCGILKTSFYLGPDGTVYPCMSMADSKLKDWPNAFQTPLVGILGDTPFMDRCATTIGMVRGGNDRCRGCKYVKRCNGGCRAGVVCSEPSMTAPDPSNCHFFHGGWHERFRKVGQSSLDAFIVAHPEVVEKPDAPTSKVEDREFGI